LIIFLPLTNSSPEITGVNPAIDFKSVLLPEPFGPTIVSASPLSIVKFSTVKTVLFL